MGRFRKPLFLVRFLQVFGPMKMFQPLWAKNGKSWIKMKKIKLVEIVDKVCHKSPTFMCKFETCLDAL